ncbi:hypothetical protein GOODEAATRI_008694 [Goodea atripinnis]|uniref:Uncharacterized protein n=1 Tax=Goodea atripinnis TaxID=208336 RepID=A0ABV0MGE9_9TELE
MRRLNTALAPKFLVSEKSARSGSRSGALREAAALQPPQVQLLPLRPGFVRQTGSASGDREDHLCRLCGEGKGDT